MKVAELKQVVDANAVEMRAEFVKVEEHFATVEEHFAKVEERFAKVEERFAKVEERFAKVEERFAKVEEKFSQVDDNFTDMRQEMRAGFAVLERRIEASRTEMRHDLTVMTEDLVDKVAMAVEQKVELMIDHKIAAAEVRLERKFTKRRAR